MASKILKRVGLLLVCVIALNLAVATTNTSHMMAEGLSTQTTTQGDPTGHAPSTYSAKYVVHGTIAPREIAGKVPQPLAACAQFGYFYVVGNQFSISSYVSCPQQMIYIEQTQIVEYCNIWIANICWNWYVAQNLDQCNDFKVSSVWCPHVGSDISHAIPHGTVAKAYITIQVEFPDGNWNSTADASPWTQF